MEELESTNGNQENRLKVKELSIQHKTILWHKGLDNRNSKERFPCLFPDSKYPQRKAGHVFSSFVLQPKHSYFPPGSRATNRSIKRHISPSRTGGRLRAPRSLPHLSPPPISVTALLLPGWESELLLGRSDSLISSFECGTAACGLSPLYGSRGQRPTPSQPLENLLI